MVTLRNVLTYLKKVTIMGAIIGLVGGSVGWWMTYNWVYLPQLELAREQNDRLREQIGFLRQQILFMNETLRLQTNQNRILQESLLRKPVVTINVYPSFEWYYIGFSDGTFRFENSTLSIPHDRPTVFKIYISNVGTGVTQLFYLGIFVETSGVIYRRLNLPNPQDLGGKILKPYDTVNATWVFRPEELLEEQAGTNVPINILFAVMSTEGTEYYKITVVVRY